MGYLFTEIAKYARILIGVKINPSGAGSLENGPKCEDRLFGPPLFPIPRIWSQTPKIGSQTPLSGPQKKGVLGGSLLCLAWTF